jgi:hypothetical protein
MFFLVKSTRHRHWHKEFEEFWENPYVGDPYKLSSLRLLVLEIKHEMRSYYKGKRWLQGERQWENFSAEELIDFLRKYDARKVDAKRKTKKNARYKKGSNRNKICQKKHA